jgi:hypothetical protein
MEVKMRLQNRLLAGCLLLAVAGNVAAGTKCNGYNTSDWFQICAEGPKVFDLSYGRDSVKISAKHTHLSASLPVYKGKDTKMTIFCIPEGHNSPDDSSWLPLKIGVAVKGDVTVNRGAGSFESSGPVPNTYVNVVANGVSESGSIIITDIVCGPANASSAPALPKLVKRIMPDQR